LAQICTIETVPEDKPQLHTSIYHSMSHFPNTRPINHYQNLLVTHKQPKFALSNRESPLPSSQHNYLMQLTSSSIT